MIYSSSATLLDGACRFLVCFIVFEMPSSPETSKNPKETATEDVFERFKTYLDHKIENLSSGLSSQSSSETGKLQRASEAGKLKFQGNKDQFLFNSELQATVDEAANFLGLRDVDKAAEKVEDLRKSLRHRQKIIKLADKSEAGWLAVKEYEAEELASDSDDEKRIRKAQERALKKKKQNAFKKSEKNKTPLSAHTSRAADDRSLFRGMLLALSLFFQRGRQVLSLCLPYSLVYLCYASAFWRRKMIFLRTNGVREKESLFSLGVAKTFLVDCKVKF